ncbi:MAG: DUF805 domain-containing protein, partial [Asticcacaulis sp.]|nr:DUF805 domain-containing protein [Asticcacaulis sp.]
EQILALSCVAAVATILLFYYRFRFFQLMVKRLHDVNQSGKLLLVWPVAWLVFVGGGITLGIMAASSDGALPAWLNVDANPWLLPVGLAPVLLFSIYLRFQLSREGTPGPNRYGPVSGAGQAARVF